MLKTKTIRKRITVKNDGFCKSKKSADERANAAADRYVEKMTKLGYEEIWPRFGGNVFNIFEVIVRMKKVI